MNLRKGGTLTILRDCLEAFSACQREHGLRVVALVHKKELALYDGIEYIELPWSTRSWVHRLWCEYMTMHKISKQIGDIDLWLSLHDTTPRVVARRQAVYCHNSYPFFRWRWQHVLLNYRIVCFALFTKWIYRINIHRNQYLIVQQQWFRNEMSRMFGIDRLKIIVARPEERGERKVERGKWKEERGERKVESGKRKEERGEWKEESGKSQPTIFLFPAFPDVHKNLECLCEAARLMEQEVGTGRFEVVLTTTRDFNKYSQWIAKRWGDVRSLRFCGFLDKESLAKAYSQADCLVFPSKVETWGLPISEFAPTGRPMLLADLPYAHETAAGSLRTAFFNPTDAKALAALMLSVINADEHPLHPVPITLTEPPCTQGWPQLIDKLLNGK